MGSSWEREKTRQVYIKYDVTWGDVIWPDTTCLCHQMPLQRLQHPSTFCERKEWQLPSLASCKCSWQRPIFWRLVLSLQITTVTLFGSRWIWYDHVAVAAHGFAMFRNASQEGRIVNTASASGPNYNAGAPAAEREMLTNPVTWHRLGAGGCSTPQLGKTMETHGKPMGNKKKPWETHGKPHGKPHGKGKLTETPGENPCCWRRIVRNSAAVQFPNPFAGVPRMSHGRSWVLPWKRWVKIQEVDSPMVFLKPAWSLTPWCWHGKNLSWKSTPWPLDTSWQTSPGAWERPNHLRKEPRRPSIVPWLSGS